MAKLQEYAKYIVNLGFVIAFVYFSVQTLIVFLNGDVAYDVRKGFDEDHIYYPSITLCPALRQNPLVNLKIQEIIDDFSITSQQVEGYRVLGTIGNKRNTSEIINSYSFQLSEIFSNESQGGINGDNFVASSKYVDIKDYAKEIKIFNKTTQTTEKQYGIEVPVGVKQIMNVYGRCFNLFTIEKPTIEQKIQGKSRYLKLAFL